MARHEETLALSNLSDEVLAELLGPYGIAPSHQLCGSMRLYISTLLLWNSKIALTTITDPSEIVRVHFGESFFAARTLAITTGRVADIGTGAGFPGIPIRMVMPGISLTLVEPITKKSAFLGEIVRKLGMSGVDIIRCRMEDLPREYGRLDAVSARALGEYRRLVKWAESRISEQGRLLLLIGEAEVLDLLQIREWNWQDPVKIPQSVAKFVLIGSHRDK